VTQLGKDWGHRGICISEKDTAANTYEDPPESLQDGLSLVIAVNLVRSVPALAIAFHSEAPRLAVDDNVYAVGTDRPLWMHSIAGSDEPTENEFLEHRLCSLALILNHSHESLRVASVLDETAAQVTGLEVSDWIHRMHQPQLIARAANRNVVALLEDVPRPGIAAGELTVFRWTINHREEDDIAFVSLELRCLATKHAMLFENIQRETVPYHSVNKRNLVITQQ
jgi:hypothetical protein